MLVEGKTRSRPAAADSRCASKASFSQVIRTSPTPRSMNVTVEPRAPESSTGTLA